MSTRQCFLVSLFCIMLTMIFSSSCSSLAQREAQGTISVMGYVNAPGEFMVENHISIRRAIQLAGGLTKQAFVERSIIIRGDSFERERVPAFDSEALLYSGDTLIVSSDGSMRHTYLIHPKESQTASPTER